MRRARQWAGVLALGLVAACSEKLTAPGDCPGNCPADHLQVLDTVIPATRDSTYSGFVAADQAARLLISNSFNGQNSIGVVRFAKAVDSISYLDTLRSATVDSIELTVELGSRDTSLTGLGLEFFRLPPDVHLDSLVTYADVVPYLTPEHRLGTVSIPDGKETGELRLFFKGSGLDTLAFTPADSNVLQLAYRLTSPQPTGITLEAAAAGVTAPGFLSWVTATLPDTTISRTLPRIVLFNSSLTDAPASTPSPDLLTAGGSPSARSILRFDLPPRVRDSAQIVRATLMLVPVEPLLALAGDTARIDVRGVYSDLGPKSPRIETSASYITTTLVQAGVTDTVKLDVTAVARLWRNTGGVPSSLVVALTPEASTFGLARFGSSRTAGAQPVLQITYALPYPFEAQ